MLEIENIRVDPLDDAVGQILAEMEPIKTWTKVRAELHQRLVAKMEELKYVRFTGNLRDYQIFRIGQSLLYQVPEGKYGHMEQFRGDLVRIVCVGGAGRFQQRLYMAGRYRSRSDKSNVGTRKQASTLR